MINSRHGKSFPLAYSFSLLDLKDIWYCYRWKVDSLERNVNVSLRDPLAAMTDCISLASDRENIALVNLYVSGLVGFIHSDLTTFSFLFKCSYSFLFKCSYSIFKEEGTLWQHHTTLKIQILGIKFKVL